MKFVLTISIIIVILPIGTAQVIPDLLSVDNYRPYLKEDEKQLEIVKTNKAEFQRFSKELYPENYTYAHPDYLDPVKGTSADPANAFQDYSKALISNGPNNPVVPLSAYNNNLSVQQRNMAIFEADYAAYKAKTSSQSQMIKQAVRDGYSPTIQYSLGTHNGKRADRFVNAYSELQAMLMGKKEIDFVKAVFLVESAYDQSLTEKEFYEMFDFSKTTIERLLIQDGLSPDDNMAKIMSIFKYMADTTQVYFPEREKPVISKPMLYDYDDYAGKQDITKVYVSKLLRSGTGQCMSLPMLYFLYSKALKTEGVYMAMAPQHSYIKFQDKLGNWNNIELTGRMFTTDDFQWQGGFVKSGQVKGGIYLNALSDKQTLAYLLTTLTLSYIKSFGHDERAMDMALTAKDHFPNSLTANMIVVGYYKDLFNNILRQYGTYNLTQKQLDNDKNAQVINDQRNMAVDHVFKDLGYAKIPDWAYDKWLEGVNELANKRQHLVKRRQLEQQLNR